MIQIWRFLRGSANLAYVHASKPTKLEDFTIQASQGFKFFTIDFQGVNQPLHQEIIQNLLTQVYPNNYNHSKQRLQICCTLTQYVWLQINAQNVRINETRIYVKLNEGCILDYRLNDNVVINYCLNLIELIYSWT